MRYAYELSYENDTVVLLHETDSILAHVSRGEWRDWGGQFPLLQKLPVLLLRSLGWREDAVLRALGVISLVSLALLLLWSWRSLYRHRLESFFLAVLLSGPLLWYGHSTFGEMLAALMTMGFVIACSEKAPAWKIFLFFVLASGSKDTGFPFLFLLRLAAYAAWRSDACDLR